jgi:dihydropteroate synthase
LSKSYLRPTGFVDAPFGHDGKVARLAGGLNWFSAVELIRLEAGRAVSELIPVERFEPPAELAETWGRLTSPRAPLALRERTIRLDQPQVVGIPNVTPDSFSDGGQARKPGRCPEAGHAMAPAGAALSMSAASRPAGAKTVWEGDEIRACSPWTSSSPGGTAVSVDTRKARMEAAPGAAAPMSTTSPRSPSTSAAGGCRAGCPVV